MESSDALTDAQSKALAVIGFTAASLSVIGSVFIIVSVIRRNLLKNLYHRIMFFMSMLDAIVSSFNACQVFLLPQSENVPWAFGNDATCRMTGFFYQFSFGVGVYNAALALYFYLTVVKGWKEEQFKKYEIPVHTYAVLVPFALAVVGLVLDAYHPLPLSRGCYIAASPRGCSMQSDLECKAGHDTVLYTWTLGAIMVLPPFLIAQTLTILLYIAFLKQEKTRTIYEFQGMRNEAAERKMKAVTAQCILYFFFLFNAVFWCTVLRILESFAGFGPNQEGGRIFPLVVLAQATYPSQGFGNLIVFLRPRYLANRREKGMTRLQSIFHVLGGSFDVNVTSETTTVSAPFLASVRNLIKRSSSSLGISVNLGASGQSKDLINSQEVGDVSERAPAQQTRRRGKGVEETLDR